VRFLLNDLLIESFYGIEIKNTDGAGMKMKMQKMKVCCFLFAVKEDNEE